MRAAVIALVVSLVAVAQAGPLQDLDNARRSFKAKDWGSAQKVLKDLLYPQPQLAEQSSVVEAHILLGVCHYEQGRRDDAKAEFEAALALDPTKTL